MKKTFLVGVCFIVLFVSLLQMAYAEETVEVTSITCALAEKDCPMICADCATGYTGGGCNGGIDYETCTCKKPYPCTSKVCKDSDGGKNYTVKGYIKMIDHANPLWDYCIDNKRLAEAVCDIGNGDYGMVYYDCPNGCSDGACIQNVPDEIIKEEVECIFDDSKTEQKCYNDKGDSCLGYSSCTNYVLGTKGQRITWKSTCGGYAYTVIDGQNEYAKFSCTGQPTVLPQPTNATETTVAGERIVAWFNIGDYMRADGKVVKLVAIPEDGSRAVIEVVGRVTVKEILLKGETKTVNGITLTVEDSVRSILLPSAENPKSAYGAFIQVECKECGEIMRPNILQPTQEYINCVINTIKSSKTQEEYYSIMEDCKDVSDVRSNFLNCLLSKSSVEEREVKDDTIVKSCGLCGNGGCNAGLEDEKTCPQDCREYPSRTVTTIGGGTIEITEEKVEKIKETPIPTTECKGCIKEGSCLDYGIRMINGQGITVYCDLDNIFRPQKAENAVCQNNFECLSNQCSNGRCIDLGKQLKETQGTLNKIMDWLRSFFGFKKSVIQGND